MDDHHFRYITKLKKKTRAWKLYLLTFLKPTHKTKMWSAQTWETTDSNLPRPVKLSTQSKTEVQSIET
jgi:hypothetical protein